MDKKYILTNETISSFGKTLYRIKAIKSFEDIKKGSLGGFVESENNLSQEGNCWVFGNAKVYDSAKVYDNARIYGTARIGRKARICRNAIVCDNAKVFGNAIVCDNAKVFGNAIVNGNVEVYDNAIIYDDAKVYGNAKIYENASVCGRAKIYDDAKIYGKANIGDNAIICGESFIKEQFLLAGKVVCDKTPKSISEIIRVQTGLIPVNGEVIAYKQVNKDLTSFYDSDFQYKVGEWAEAENVDESNISCTNGLHFSNANYWNLQTLLSGRDSTFLIAKIKLEDIVTVQEGKIRCRKAFILGKYDIND